MTENLRLLRNTLARDQLPFRASFNMMYWKVDRHDDCGTICCIGGMVDLLRGETNYSSFATMAHVGEVADWLGIDPDVAWLLFHPATSGDRYDLEDYIPYNTITKEQALETVDIVMRGGGTAELYAYWETQIEGMR